MGVGAFFHSFLNTIRTYRTGSANNSLRNMLPQRTAISKTYSLLADQGQALDTFPLGSLHCLRLATGISVVGSSLKKVWPRCWSLTGGKSSWRYEETWHWSPGGQNVPQSRTGSQEVSSRPQGPLGPLQPHPVAIFQTALVQDDTGFR